MKSAQLGSDQCDFSADPTEAIKLFVKKKKVFIILNHCDLGWFLTQQGLITYAKKMVGVILLLGFLHV